MRMLRYMSVNTLNDRIVNENIGGKLGIALIEDKMWEDHLRWFNHVHMKKKDATVRRIDHFDIIDIFRVIRRPKKSWI